MEKFNEWLKDRINEAAFGKPGSVPAYDPTLQNFEQYINGLQGQLNGIMDKNVKQQVAPLIGQFSQQILQILAQAKQQGSTAGFGANARQLDKSDPSNWNLPYDRNSPSKMF